jgi:hypothetical protein
MTQTYRRLATSAAALAILAVPLLAAAPEEERTKQNQSVTPTTKSLFDPADAVLDRMLVETPVRQEATVVEQPNFQVEAGSSSPRRLLREGTFVIDRVGTVRRLDDGSILFVFQSDGDTAASAGDPPMWLVPNLNLMAVESAISQTPNQRFRVTGRVTEYRGRNHLVLEKLVIVG